MNSLRADIAEIHVNLDTDLNSEKFRESAMNLPIVILRKFLRHPNCDELNSSKTVCVAGDENSRDPQLSSVFSLDIIDRMYGIQKITVLNQDVDVSGFNIDDKNMWEKMPLQSFLLYLKGLHQLINIAEDICVTKKPSLLDAAIVCMGSQSSCERDKSCGHIYLKEEKSRLLHNDNSAKRGSSYIKGSEGCILSNGANITTPPLCDAIGRASAIGLPNLELIFDSSARRRIDHSVCVKKYSMNAII